MSITKDQIELLIADELESIQVVMLDAVVSGSPRKPLVQLFIDCKDRPMTIKICADLARKIRDIFSLQDNIPRDYRLEVSSPGIDYPLNEIWQFKKNIGRHIQFTEDNLTMTGKLMGVSADNIIILRINDETKDFILET